MRQNVFIVSAPNVWKGIDSLTPVWIDSSGDTPKTLYFIDVNDSQLYECVRQTNKFQSFFLQNTVISDGNYYVFTPVDVVFIILPFVLKKRKQFHSLFEILSDVLVDKEMVPKMETSLDPQIISAIVDIKYINEEMYVRYNSQKTMEWLSIKIDNTVEALSRNEINVSSSGCKVSGYKTGKEDITQEKAQFTKMAFELISRYLTTELSNDLHKQLRLSDETNDSSVPKTSTQHKRKLDENESSGVFEDYSSYRGGTSSSTQDKKATKMSRSQRELLKVDKTGMKSISSFFAAKPK